MEFRDDPGNHRYVAEQDGEVVGYAVYHVRGGRYLLVHTQVDEALEGQGVGSRLASFALDDVRARGTKVVPLCPFIASYIDRHPDYADLVDETLLARIDGSPRA